MLNRTTGNIGEEIAAKFLNERGFSVLEKNYRYKRSEIDIIAKNEDVLVFVEVKTRTSKAFGEPEEAVTQKKIEMIMEAAENYILVHDWKKNIRFDIISIVLNNNSCQIDHFEDAFN